MEKRIKEQIDTTKKMIDSAERLIEEIESEIVRLYNVKDKTPQQKAQLTLLYHLANIYDDTL